MYVCCLYRSQSLVHPRSRQCADIYLTARDLNSRVNITGYLHHEQAHFVQFIEGPKWAIDVLLKAIKRDPRHTEMETLLYFESDTRRFKHWDMAFTDHETRRFQDWARTRDHCGRIAQASGAEMLAFLNHYDLAKPNTPIQNLSA